MYRLSRLGPDCALIVELTMPLTALLSVQVGVGGCGLPSSASVVLIIELLTPLTNKTIPGPTNLNTPAGTLTALGRARAQPHRFKHSIFSPARSLHRSLSQE